MCGTTGKRKACKDCSCGLAEELEAGQADKPVVKSATSSCGSVNLKSHFFYSIGKIIKSFCNFSAILEMLSVVLVVPILECLLLNQERRFNCQKDN